MKKIYFLHGYQTSGKKFECLRDFYKDSKEFLPVNWEWNEYMDIPKFLEDKKRILQEEKGEKILMADSMGANIAWNLVNEFPDLHYVMTNPVFSPDQILEQARIPSDLRNKIFSLTTDSLKNKNIHLVISKFDETLDPTYYKKVLGGTFEVLEIPDEHRIVRMKEWMPLIHKQIVNAFEKKTVIN